MGLGYAVLHEPRIIVEQIVAEDSKSELARLDVAIKAMRASIDKLVDQGDTGHGETRDILETSR